MCSNLWGSVHALRHSSGHLRGGRLQVLHSAACHTACRHSSCLSHPMLFRALPPSHFPQLLTGALHVSTVRSRPDSRAGVCCECGDRSQKAVTTESCNRRLDARLPTCCTSALGRVFRLACRHAADSSSVVEVDREKTAAIKDEDFERAVVLAMSGTAICCKSSLTLTRA